MIITLRIHFTEVGVESKRKEESSEEEDARKEAAFSKDARKEAYTKAQSMKSLFQQGQTITTKRCKIHGIDQVRLNEKWPC